MKNIIIKEEEVKVYFIKAQHSGRHLLLPRGNLFHQLIAHMRCKAQMHPAILRRFVPFCLLIPIIQ